MDKSDVLRRLYQLRKHTRDIRSCSCNDMTLEYNDGVDYALTVAIDLINKIQSLD